MIDILIDGHLFLVKLQHERTVASEHHRSGGGRVSNPGTGGSAYWTSDLEHGWWSEISVSEGGLVTWRWLVAVPEELARKYSGCVWVVGRHHGASLFGRRKQATANGAPQDTNSVATRAKA